MNKSNSNAVSRRKAIGKAAFLVLIPMLFAAVGATLVSQAEEVDARQIEALEAEIAAMKKDRDVFLAGLGEMGAAWSSYQKLQQQSLHMEDSLSTGALNLKIDQKEKELGKLLNQIEISMKDTAFSPVYLASIQNYRALIKNYDGQVEDKKSLMECLSGIDGSLRLMEQINGLEEDNLELQEKYKELLNKSSDCKSLEREIRRTENQLRDCNNALADMKEKYEDMKQKRDGLAMGYGNLIEETKKNLGKMKVEGICIGCKKVVNDKIDAITEEIDKGAKSIIERQWP